MGTRANAYFICCNARSAHVFPYSTCCSTRSRSLGGKICFPRDGERNAPPSSRPKLSLSLKRRFATLEREEVDQYSLVKVPDVRCRATTGSRAILKSGEETTT